MNEIGFENIKDENFTYSDGIIRYEITEDYAYVKGVMPNYNHEHIIIKGKVFDKTVIMIMKGAFKSLDYIKSIQIPKTIKFIEEDAFCDMESLEKIIVTKDNNYYSSNQGVLFNKDKSELIKYPENKQGSYKIPKSVNKINKFAFSNVHGLTKITVPSSVKYIEDFAFSKAFNLEEIIFEPNSKLKSIGIESFNGCCSLKKIFIPKSVLEIKGLAFSGCVNLNEIIFEDDYLNSTPPLTLQGLMFINNSKLIKLTLPERLREIPSGLLAFTHIETIKIPKSVEIIDDNAFNIGLKLKKIIVNEKNKSFTSVDGILYDKNLKTLIKIPPCYEKEHTIPNSVKTIKEGAVSFNTKMKKIVIPLSVDNIEQKAFANSKNILIYSESNHSKPTWHYMWNPNELDVIWNYKISSNFSN